VPIWVDLRTIHVGPDDLVVAAGIAADPSQTASAIARSIVEAEALAAWRRFGP